VNPKSRQPLLNRGIVLNGKWEILEHIATGGKGEVYRARQLNLDREVAVKIISKEFLAAFDGDEEEIQVEMDRFRREVVAMAQVRNQNVLQVYDQDRAVVRSGSEEVPIDYIVMEYIPGPTLRSTMPPEGLRESEEGVRRWIQRYFLPVLEGVETIHALGIVHRDLKPENVLLDDFTPKITDFGLVGGPRWQHLTRSHHMIGTIQYMAPEQFVEMGETDFRGDIYSLGKILYEAVSGKMDKDTSFPFKSAHLPNPDTPFLKRLDIIVQQATAEDRKQRFPSIEIFRQAIVDLLEETGGREVSKSVQRFREPYTKGLKLRRNRLIMGAMGLAVAVIIGFVILSQREKLPASIGLRQPSISRSVHGLPSQQAEINGPEASPVPIVSGKDGATLHLVPGGTVILPKSFGTQAGKSVQVNSFYMDETEVTNHQYVEFLNKVLPRVRVEKGVVQGDGEIWLLLGEVMEGYEPIVLQDGKFFIKDPALAAHPVVRVTGYGAAAYARFYGRRLPTEVEWLHALKADGWEQGVPPGGGDESIDMNMHTQMHSSSSGPAASVKTPATVALFQPNALGIRGMDGNVSEWGIRTPKTSSGGKKESEYGIMGGLSNGEGQESFFAAAIPRYPWEAFEKVGFRCVRSIKSRGR